MALINAPGGAGKTAMNDATFRASVVGAGEVAALFDASPWLTRFELWHRKAGNIAVPEFNAILPDGTPENERIHWGVELEGVILKEAQRRWGYCAIDRDQVLDNGRGLGGHPDAVAFDGTEKVVLEVKTADWLQAKKWGDEPPLNYLLQNMAYQGLAGCVRGDIIVLVGGNDLRRFQYEFRPALYEKIKARVEAFWTDVRAGIAPKPDYARDGDALADVIGAPDDRLVDLRRNNRAGELAADFLDAKAREKLAAKDAEVAKNELLETIGTAGAAMLEGYRVSCAMTKGNPGTLITEAHLGQIINKRAGYRRFDVKEWA